MPGFTFLQPVKQRLATSTLALISSTGKMNSQKAMPLMSLMGLKNQPAFSWMKNRDENSATARLTMPPASSSCTSRLQVSRIQKT